jgi:Tfp pilus assembly protein PilF
VGVIENLEALLAKGEDNALLRFGLGNAYLQQGRPAQAVAHLERAVALDPGYSAAWKLYGKALAELGRHDEAAAIFEQGIRVAEERGDVQAAREMKVFLKREKAKSL